MLGFGLAGLCLWLIFRRLNFGEGFKELAAAYKGAELGLLGLAALCLGLGYACRIERWRRMLLHENPKLSWKDCAGPLLGCFAANNILPLRLGDVMRTLAFNRQLGISAGTALSSVVVERLLDLLMLLALLGGALAWFGLWFGLELSGLLGDRTLNSFATLLFISAAALVMLALFWPSLFKPMAICCCRGCGKIIPKLGEAMLRQADKAFAALEYAASGPTLRPLLLLSLLAWTAEGCVFYLVGLALPSISLAAGGWLALPLGSLATLVPSTPGYAGTFDYFAMQGMLALGESAPAAAAFAFLVHAVLWLPVTLLGAGYLLLIRWNKSA